MTTDRIGATKRHVLCTSFGSADDLQIVESPIPHVMTDCTLVEVDAAGVGFVDSLIVQGKYQVRPPLPFTPGFVVAGRVVQVGADVRGLSVGASVYASLPSLGGFTSHIALPSDAVAPVPLGCDTFTAVAALQSYGPVAFAFEKRVTVEQGEWVMILGAGGAIGMAAIAFARARRARIIAVASSEEKRHAALAAGAEVALDYPLNADHIRHHTGAGVDVAIDPVGGEAGESLPRLLNSGGRYCVMGFASGRIPTIPTNRVLLRNRSIVGVDWGDYCTSHPADAATISHRLLVDVGTGKLPEPRYTAYPLDDAASAFRDLHDRRAIGNLILTTKS